MFEKDNYFVTRERTEDNHMNKAKRAFKFVRARY